PVNWLAGVPTPGAATGPALAALPSITTQPQSQTAAAGANVSFTVLATGGSLRYQWRFAGANISGATNTSLSVTNVQLTNGGNYSVLIVNSVGAVLSQKALLIVQAPPRITRQPENRSVEVGGNAFFSVTAEGSPPLRYQWQFNSSDL